MHTKGIKLALSFPLLGIILNAYSSINPSHLNIQPITDPLINIPVNENGTVKYLLSNNGGKVYHLQLTPSPGLSQETKESDACGRDILLLPGKHCVLNLVIDGTQAISFRKNGPVVCEKGWAWSDEAGFSSNACLQPKPNERMSLNLSSSSKATLSIKINPEGTKNSRTTMKQCFASMAGCVLTLFQNSTTQKSIVLTNTSTIVGKDIQAYGLPTGVTQNASNCKILNPNSSCTITFKAGGTKNSGKSVTIKGSNTASSTITMKVLGIGDPFAGGIIGCMGGGLQNLIATRVPASDFYQWGNDEPVFATSKTDGQANTTKIVTVIGNNMSQYGAKLCNEYEVDANGNSPCKTGTCYSDWFLPAENQLICLSKNSLIDSQNNYWSSTEVDPQTMTNFAIYLTQGVTGPHPKNLFEGIRCVSSFTP